MSDVPHHLRILVETLARLYSASTAGTRGATRDFTVEREEFLSAARASDGDARELAEEFLAGIDHWSGGTVVTDRHPRSKAVVALRVRRNGGEEWLFAFLEQPSPSAKRDALADFFVDAASQAPGAFCEQTWKAMFLDYADAARSGRSVQPFFRDGPCRNSELLLALRGVMNWREPSLIRYASAVICGDSKVLESLAPRIAPMLERLTGSASLEDRGILAKPRMVTVHGPLIIECNGNRVDLSPLAGATRLSDTTLLEAEAIFTGAPCCLTVENEDSFWELCKLQTGILLIHTSYPGAATRTLVQKLPPSLPRYHFGDTDPAGFDILRDLREKTGLPVLPFLMAPDLSTSCHESYRPYSHQEQQLLQRLAESSSMEDLATTIGQMILYGGKSRYEQELIPLNVVANALHALSEQAATPLPLRNHSQPS